MAYKNIPLLFAAQKLDLDEAMFTALIQDKDEFVNLFIDSGLNLRKFLTVQRLYDLYKDVCVNERNSSLKNTSFAMAKCNQFQKSSAHRLKSERHNHPFD